MNLFTEDELYKIKANLEERRDWLESRGVVMKTDNNLLPRLIMFRDSFTTSMIPFISEHFSTSVYNWNHAFDSELIMEFKPDVVVHELVERHLNAFLLENPQIIKESN